MKHWIWCELTFLRDKPWIRGRVLKAIDWLRYEVFYPYKDDISI